MSTKPVSAMLLAAGLGTRMRPLTNDRPKPLLPVRGKPMIDRAIDHLKQAGISRIVVNLHYKGSVLRDHLEQRRDPTIFLIDEPELLDTGLGVKNALPLLGTAPFFAINADQVWTDRPGIPPALNRLAAAWDDSRMDALMLMKPLTQAFGFDGSKGDFFLDPLPAAEAAALQGNSEGLGLLARFNRPAPRPYVWMSVQLIRPESYIDTPDRPFSNNLVWSRSEQQGRLYGLVHEGDCYQVGTPKDLAQVNALTDFQAPLSG